MKTLIALVGMRFLGTVALVASLPAGEPLMLVREPNNPYDRNAVQVWARGVHVGYCKAGQVIPIAQAMDAQAQRVRVTDPAKLQQAKPAKLAIDGGRWPMVEIEL